MHANYIIVCIVSYPPTDFNDRVEFWKDHFGYSVKKDMKQQQKKVQLGM